jgi:hypothetical protein
MGFVIWLMKSPSCWSHHINLATRRFGAATWTTLSGVVHAVADIALTARTVAGSSLGEGLGVGSTPDPQGAEDFAKRTEAIGYATEGVDHVARLEPRSSE